MLDLLVTLAAALVAVGVTLLPRGYLIRTRRLPIGSDRHDDRRSRD